MNKPAEAARLRPLRLDSAIMMLLVLDRSSHLALICLNWSGVLLLQQVLRFIRDQQVLRTILQVCLGVQT